ncbi:MAG TPA: DUF2207 domain-containing protein, partial [Longimicrobiales bacterium]|nr:DUF2207 domain-containing protein [Longimicrobiales bacterium]
MNERITARFTGQWNGIYRTIPLAYDAPGGLNYRLFVDFKDAQSEDGGQLRSETKREGGNLKIKVWVPAARDATRTILLNYRVFNGLRFFKEHDELYWNVTGNDWDVPLESASARITLPGRVTGVRANAFTGTYGSTTNNASIVVDGHTVTIQTTQPLQFHEGLTAVAGWNPGVVKRPDILAKAGMFLRSNLLLLIPLLTFGFMFLHWNRYGKDPRQLPIAPRYEPPNEMTPAEVGTLIDNSADIRDITATIVDLAVRGYLTIEEKEESHLLGLTKSKSYSFRKNWTDAPKAPLAAHEERLMESLFRSGGLVHDSDLQNKFYEDLPDITEAIFDALVFKRCYKTRPASVAQKYAVIGVIVGMVIGVSGHFLAAHTPFITFTAAIISAIASALIIILFGRIMPVRSVYGARELEKVLGFEEFLRRVESDRFERLIKTPEMFEKYLPYAMSLKLDRQWCNAFADIYTTPPRWYAGNYSTFNMHSLHGSLNQMA